jgi:hypothetical protein
MMIVSKRVLVECGCDAVYSYPAEIDRAELECPECGSEPLRGMRDQVAAILDENDEGVDGFAKAVLNDGSRTVV